MSFLLPRSFLQRLTDPIVGVLASLGLSPNHLTLIGVLGNVGAAVLVARGQFLPGGIVTLAASAVDLLDGALARATGRATAFGSIFDAVMDRVSEAAVLFGLMVWFSGRDDRDGVLLAFAAMAGSILVSYVRARAEIVGVSTREGIFARPERVLVLGIGLIIDEVTVVLWILAIAANLTAAQRLFLAWRRSQEPLEEGDRSDSA
ncbi:MAG: CDP-alcohol phosphatidyltransferase family protein [Chloroflexi bacterium]|nr:CDP-alcohol phosphatidyltransferase family protein [Chloroflexota bacterium]